MNKFNALKQAIEKCEAVKASLTPAQMENAMINMDNMAPNFGLASVFFRTIERVEGNQSFLAPVTLEQFDAYLANKREMFATHNYL